MSQLSRSILPRLGRALLAVLLLVALSVMASTASATSALTPAEVHMSIMDDCHHAAPLRSHHAPAACAGLMACCAALPAMDAAPLRRPMAVSVVPLPAMSLWGGQLISPLFEPPRRLV